MRRPLILASASPIRLQLLRAAGVAVTAQPPRIDEDALRAGLEAEAAKPHDIADALAEMKARKVADRNPAALVLGCDQVLEFGGAVWSKPDSPAEALSQLRQLRGQTHRLLSAAVIYDATRPVWRVVQDVRLTMRPLSDGYLDDYIGRNWDSIRHAVGCYKLEKEGSRLFSAVEGDYFTVLGLPLFAVLGYLGQREVIAT